MTIIRHVLGFAILKCAEALVRRSRQVAHRMCHIGAWLMDHDANELCEQCQDNEPMDGPWAI